MLLRKLMLIIISLCFSQAILAEEITVTMNLLLPLGKQPVGTINIQDTPYGLLLTPQLSHLAAGIHGFHIHQHPSCEDKGMAAGGHLDPAKTEKHLGPYNSHGHLGDLPVLIVDSKGKATLPVLAPRLKISDIVGHSIMIHLGGDNYADNPAMGGGGMRMVCGVIK